MAAGLFSRPGLRPLLQRDFRLLLAGSALVSLLMPLHLMTQLFWVSERFANDAVLYSSILAGSRGAGMVLFSLAGGAIADRAERKRVLMVCESLSLVAHAAIAVLMLTEPGGAASVGMVAGVTFLAAGIQSVDSPARSASIPLAAGPANVSAAIALLAISGQLTMPLALPIAGVLSEVFAPGAVYAGTLLAWAGILPAIAALQLKGPMPKRASGTMLASIRDGLSYTRSNRPILAIVSVVLVVQVIGMPVATPLGPMFEIEVLGFTPSQVGLMGATWGLGSFTATLILARAGGLALRGGSLAFVSCLFGVAILGFGYSRFIPLTAVSDYGMGFAFTGTNLVASTLVQHLVADEVRGRVLSLFPFSLGLAQAATALAGLAGGVLGLAVLLPALGWLVIGGCLFLVVVHREMLGARVRPRAAAA